MGGKILAAGEHLRRMVGDLLDAGRLESGRLSLDRQMVDLRDVAETALESARAAHVGARIQMKLPPEPVTVEADRSRLLQVVTNLLQNAARYGPHDGEVRLIVNTGNAGACIAVEDEGPGIPPGERERIFDKFYRTPGAQAKVKKGLGLGLTIARDLVVAHGGRIHVEDAPSGGARFVVELPRAEA
jgi:signal transduction histidine kinase